MEIQCVWEHNGGDSILYAVNFVGAFSRGESLEQALEKMPREVISYLRWLGVEAPDVLTAAVVQEKASDLEIRDADSDVMFDMERLPMSGEEYARLKELAMKSAVDFHALYESVADKNTSCLPFRRSFYGDVPRTAEEMYRHTRDVNSYYFSEIGVRADNSGTIAECRARAFEALERQPDYLRNTVFDGSYGEEWSLRKVLRRFVWHDRIHARAMWRMALKTFGEKGADNVFRFEK